MIKFFRKTKKKTIFSHFGPISPIFQKMNILDKFGSVSFQISHLPTIMHKIETKLINGYPENFKQTDRQTDR